MLGRFLLSHPSCRQQQIFERSQAIFVHSLQLSTNHCSQVRISKLKHGGPQTSRQANSAHLVKPTNLILSRDVGVAESPAITFKVDVFSCIY